MDIQFAAAMGVGRGSLPKRLIRHFNVVEIAEMETEVLGEMCSAILQWGFRAHVDKVKFLVKGLININLNVFRMVAKEFLPLPKKSHYLFNLRDLMKAL